MRAERYYYTYIQARRYLRVPARCTDQKAAVSVETVCCGVAYTLLGSNYFCVQLVGQGCVRPQETTLPR